MNKKYLLDFNLLVTLNGDKNLLYIVKKQKRKIIVRKRSGFVFKISAKELSDAYDKLHQFLNKKFYKLNIEDINIKCSFYEKFDIQKFMINNAYIVINENKNKIVDIKNKKDFMEITHKHFGKIYFVNKYDIQKFNKKIEFLVPYKNKYKKTWLMYELKYFDRNSIFKYIEKIFK